MGSNGRSRSASFIAAGSIDFGSAPPLLGVDGKRHTPLSTNGYVISATASTPSRPGRCSRTRSPRFLASTWGETRARRPGSAVGGRHLIAWAPRHRSRRGGRHPRRHGGGPGSSGRTPPGAGDAYGRDGRPVHGDEHGLAGSSSPGRPGPDRGGGERCACRGRRALSRGGGRSGRIGRLATAPPATTRAVVLPADLAVAHRARRCSR